MNNTPIKLKSRNPDVFQIDIETLTELLTGDDDDAGEKLLYAIAKADDELYNAFYHAIKNKADTDVMNIKVENFLAPINGLLIMSRVMIASKTFAAYMEYNIDRDADFVIEFNKSDPEAAKEEFRQRLDLVKGLREAVTFSEPVRITA